VGEVDGDGHGVADDVADGQVAGEAGELGELIAIEVADGASLLYFNMNYVRDTIEERVRAEKETKLVVLDLSEVSIVDMHAAEMLAGLAGELASKGIKIQAGEAHSQVRDRLRSEGLEERFGGIERLRTAADVADDFLRRGLGREDVHVALGDLGADQYRDRPSRQGWKRRGGTGKQ
jgi:anti-anti-sigma regulatory factor